MKLSALEQRRKAIVSEIEAEMKSLIPGGSIVLVYLSSVQKRPSEAEVFHANGADGTYRILLTKPSARGRRVAKSVHWSRIEIKSNTGISQLGSVKRDEKAK